ncbi:hypothetical protein CFP56_023544 [Quercus suber]|uniref:Uncharacterized protein n=1 Tax=Quercus suber TaxID=58331 RepID=A0AAW0JZ93_QUESU
MINFPLTGGRM